MTDVEHLLRGTFRARAGQAPPEHRVVARSRSGTTHPTQRRAWRVAGAAVTVGVAAAVVVGFSVTRGGDTPRAIDGSTGSASETTETPTPSPTPPPDYSNPTLALNEYTNAVTIKIVTCLQDQGFAVVMNKNSQMTDGAGHDQLTYRVPPALQESPEYRAASLTCMEAAQAAVPRPPS